MTAKRPETPGGSAVSRETSRALGVGNPEVELGRPLASEPENRMRGGPVKAGPTQRERNPEGEKTQESYALGFRRKQPDRVADSRVEQNPEGVKNAKRGEALGTAYGCAGGGKLWRATPGADPTWNKVG